MEIPNCGDRRARYDNRKWWREVWQFVALFFTIAMVVLLAVCAIIYVHESSLPKALTAIVAALVTFGTAFVWNRANRADDQEESAYQDVQGCPGAATAYVRPRWYKNGVAGGVFTLAGIGMAFGAYEIYQTRSAKETVEYARAVNIQNQIAELKSDLSATRTQADESAKVLSGVKVDLVSARTQASSLSSQLAVAKTERDADAQELSRWRSARITLTGFDDANYNGVGGDHGVWTRSATIRNGDVIAVPDFREWVSENTHANGNDRWSSVKVTVMIAGK